jgi:hypothetical protein
MDPSSTAALGSSSQSTLPSDSGDPERPDAGSRRVIAWSIATLLITVASVLAVVVDWRSPVRTVLALAFLLFAPGLALAELLAIREPVQRLALVAGASGWTPWWR